MAIWATGISLMGVSGIWFASQVADISLTYGSKMEHSQCQVGTDQEGASASVGGLEICKGCILRVH